MLINPEQMCQHHMAAQNFRRALTIFLEAKCSTTSILLQDRDQTTLTLNALLHRSLGASEKTLAP